MDESIHRANILWLILAIALGLAVDVGAVPPRSPHGAIARACTDCHTTSSWRALRFDHSQTSFELRARHAEADCVACHRLDDFEAATSVCLSCHADGHEGALGPDCAVCHAEDDWRSPHFEHELTAFPLWGAHGAADCIQCHANEVTWQLAVRPQSCYDCHAVDFSRTRVAVHLTAGPDCETCHTLDQWQGGHDPIWFEIRSGNHEVGCGRCHKRVPDYASYTCNDCHEFSLEESEHFGIDPLDARCLDCHDRGGFDD